MPEDNKQKLVKVRVRRLIEELDPKTKQPTGKTRNAAQPIVLSSSWRKLCKGFALPERLEVGGIYELPEIVATGLGADVELAK